MSTSTRRRGIATLTIIVVVAIVIYLAGPWALRKWAEDYFSDTLAAPVELSHLSFNPFTATAAFSNLRIGEGETPMIDVGHGDIEFEWATLWRSGVHIADVRLESPRLHLVSSADGSLNVTQLGSGAQRAGGGSQKGSGDATGNKASLSIDNIEANDGRIDWLDRRGGREASLVVTGIDLSLADYARGSGSPMHGQASGTLGGGELDLEGRFGITPFTGDLAVNAQGVALETFQPWLESLTSIRLQGGTADLDGQVRFGNASETTLAYQGGLQLASIEAVDEQSQPLVSLQQGRFEEIDWVSGEHLVIDAVTLSAPQANALVGENGEFNLAAAFGGGQSGEGAAGQRAPDQRPDSQASGMAVALGRVDVEQGAFHFEDRRMSPTVVLNVDDVSGQVSRFDTRSETPARYRFEGSESGNTPVHLEGEVGFGQTLTTRAHLTTERLTLSQFAPYFVRFAGYRIEHGIADLDLDYRLEGDTLTASNHLVLRRLALGEELDASETSLPLKNLVALLQAQNGQIDLDIPIETSVDGSRVDISVVVWQAIAESLENLVTSPVDTLQALISAE